MSLNRKPRDSLSRSRSSRTSMSPFKTGSDLTTVHESSKEWYDFRPHRRTFQSSTLSEKQPVTVRKTKSLRESSRSKLKSPPPPPKQSKSERPDKLPSLPVLNDDMPSLNKAFAEYQGYSRHSRHGSFTYSPPPRTSSLNESSVPAVPPVPKIHKSRTNSLRKKRSDTSRPPSDMSNISNVNFLHNNESISELQKELDRMLSDLSEPNVMENINHDLAQIEKDIKALALERDRHASFIEQKKVESNKSTGRKRGKTLPGNLAAPPPIPTLVLPPMKLNPLQLTIPTDLHSKKKRSPVSSTNLSSSSTKIKLSSLDNLDGITKRLDKKLSLPNLAKRKSNQIPLIRRTASYKQPDGKPVQTILKYYGPYLSDYERHREIQDYTSIYFIAPHAKKHHHNQGFDNERGDYKIVMQDHLIYRYEILEVLGSGSFGQVVKCFDHKTNQPVAVKIIRNKKRFHAQGMTEIATLKKLIEWDPNDEQCTIKMTDHFVFRGHLCIAFECLCMNLYEFIKSNQFQGFSLGLIKRITYQILQSLAMLAEHDLIHCDLKPENIMLKQPGKSSIKVIDFGSSCFESERVYTYIQSRFYRSPEVILGISYHKAIDMWSLGCIIAEMYTGIPLFPGENEQEQLGCIMEVLGLPDRHIIEKSSRRKLFFDSMGNPRIVTNSKGKKRLPCTKSLFQVLKCNDLIFLDFVERCLQWDPVKRMTPKEALKHAWLTSNTSTAPVKPVTFLSASPTMAH